MRSLVHPLNSKSIRRSESPIPAALRRELVQRHAVDVEATADALGNLSRTGAADLRNVRKDVTLAHVELFKTEMNAYLDLLSDESSTDW